MASKFYKHEYCKRLAISYTRLRIRPVGLAVTYWRVTASVKYRHLTGGVKDVTRFLTAEGESTEEAGRFFDRFVREGLAEAWEIWGFDCSSGHCS
jgi:hypothetical protein